MCLCVYHFYCTKFNIFTIFTAYRRRSYYMAKHFSSEILSKYLFYDKAHITGISFNTSSGIKRTNTNMNFTHIRKKRRTTVCLHVPTFYCV